MKLRANFHKSPRKKPPFFISYLSDKYCSIWTHDKPDNLIWKRTVKLAKISYNRLMDSLFNLDIKAESYVDFSAVFTASLNDYDVLIWLKPTELPKIQEKTVHRKVGGHPSKEITTWSSYAEYQLINIDASTVNIDYDPLGSYVRELEDRLKDFALFFYDPYGLVIGVLWKPAVFLPSKFKLKNCVNTIPISDFKNDLIGTLPNIFSIISDMKSIGEGLVSKIELVKNSAKIPQK